MEKRELGRTGLFVSRLCFGTLTMGPFQRNLSISEGTSLMERAFSHGVNFLDTAEIYETYPYVKQALKIKPDAIVCTKSYAYTKEMAEESFRKAVEGIGRDHIDIFMLHEQESGLTIRGHKEALDYFLDMKRKGYIRAVGLSTHYVECMRAACTHPELDVLFPLINKKGVGIADGTPEQMLEQIETAHKLGKGVFAMKPLGGGHLINDREEAMNYILGIDSLDAIAIGMQSIAEVDYNCALLAGKTPAEEDAIATKKAPRHLLIQDWCEGCGACVDRCANRALRLEKGRAEVDHEKCALCGYCATVCPQFTIKVI
ncbi:MAG: aldo/keto reductase [Clostridiales bacterium]|nr:aldo/keto reductase [Clostridiales bacterium]MDD7550947.1 aldo/keto reductase [Clostridia bacterium]MDY5754376.1 aldo/keto reductase [Eubacteriales bacterium]